MHFQRSPARYLHSGQLLAVKGLGPLLGLPGQVLAAQPGIDDRQIVPGAAFRPQTHAVAEPAEGFFVPAQSGQQHAQFVGRRRIVAVRQQGRLLEHQGLSQAVPKQRPGFCGHVGIELAQGGQYLGCHCAAAHGLHQLLLGESVVPGKRFPGRSLGRQLFSHRGFVRSGQDRHVQACLDLARRRDELLGFFQCQQRPTQGLLVFGGCLSLVLLLGQQFQRPQQPLPGCVESPPVSQLHRLLNQVANRKRHLGGLRAGWPWGLCSFRPDGLRRSDSSRSARNADSRSLFPLLGLLAGKTLRAGKVFSRW